MAVYIGIDGGATKTIAVIVDENGTVLGSARSGASNVQVTGRDRAARFMGAALHEALAQAKSKMTDVYRTVIGFAGLDGPADVLVAREIAMLVGMPSPWVGVNDSVVAWAGALEGKPGGVIVAGTGAIAFAVNGVGESARADGWGHWVGDEGSAFDVGRQGIRAVLRAMDGRGPETALLENFKTYCQGLGEPDWNRWIARLNSDANRAHVEIAGFGQEVAHLADTGTDSVAQEIIQDAAQKLALTTWSAIRRVGLADEGSVRVGMIGSLLLGSSLLRRLFERELRGLAPGCRLQEPVLQAAEGAALLARRPELIPKDVLLVQPG